MWVLPCVPEELIIDTVMTFTLEAPHLGEQQMPLLSLPVCIIK